MLALSNKAATIAKEAVQKSQEQQQAKKPTTKKGGKQWLEEMVTKQEIIDRVGIVDPIIQPKIEKTLSSISYAGKTKAEVTNDLVDDLEKQVEKLKYQRVKMLQEQQKAREAGNQRDEDIVPEDPDEVLFQKAFKAQDTEKLHEIVDKRRSKLEELERKWREKKELEQMRNEGLLDSDTYTKMVAAQKPGPSKLYNESSNRTVSPSRVSAIPVTKSTYEEKPVRDRPLTQALTYQADVPQKDEDLKDLLKKSEKLRAIDPRRSDFDKKVSDYLVGKSLKNETEEYYKSKEKRKFERHTSPSSLRKSQDKYDALRGSGAAPISHLPIISDEKKQNEKENRQNNLQSKSPEKKVNKRKVHEINELFIIKLVFDALNHENKGVISKDEVIDYVLTNQDIVTIFDLKSSFSGEVLTFASEKVGLLTFHEFSQLMMKRLPPKTQKEIKSAFPFEKPRPQERHQEMQHQDMLLSQDEVKIFSEIFTDLDKYEDLLIKTEDYLNALRGDMRIQQIIKKPAVKIPVVDRELTVGEILDQIETDMTTAVENGTNTMQYISWNQFLDYFKTYKASKFTRQQPNKEEDADEMLLSEEKLQVLQDVFDMLPRVAEDYVDKIEFVKASKQDPQVHSFWKQEVDTDNGRTVGKIFDQILASEANYLKWEEVLPFFTRGGAPAKAEDDQEMQDTATQVNKNEFPTFAPDHISEAAKEDESRGDLSPGRSPPPQERGKRQEVDIKTKKATSKDPKSKREKSREPNNFDNLDAELRKEYELLQEDLKAYGIVKKNLKDDKGLTIPKPFKFQAKDNEAKSIRQTKVAKMVEEKQKEEEDALNFKFRANELPAYVKVPMYGTITKAQEERRMEVTEKSKQMTLANQKPFSFYERDKEKQKPVAKEESFSQFKAKDVPQFCKVEVMKQKEEEDKKKRDERIKARMEDNLVNAKLPPRMEMHEKAKKEGTNSKIQNPNKYQEPEASFKPKINRDVPDFEQQQKDFETNLQTKKKEVPKTQFKPFGFQQKEESAREASQKEEVSVKNVKKQAPKKVVKQAAKPKPAKKPQQQEEEEQVQEEEQPKDEAEEEYPPDEDQQENVGEEEGGSKKGGQSNMGDEEEKGEDNGDFFQVEEQEAGDEAFNPAAMTRTKPEKKEEAAPKSEAPKSEGSARGSLRGTGSVKGEEKKKPMLTKKLEQEFERRRKDKEAAEKRAEDKKREDEERKKKEKDFAPKVVSAYNTVNRPDKREEENKERIKESRNRMKQQQVDYDEKIKEMKTKLDTAPLMIENKMSGSKFLQKYRDALAKGWTTLEAPAGEAARSEQNEVSQRQDRERETRRPTRQETKPKEDEENIQRGSSRRQIVKKEEKEPEEQNEAAEPEEQQEEPQEANEQRDVEENNNEEEQPAEQPKEPQEAAANEEDNGEKEENQGDNEENKEKDEEKAPSENYEEEFEQEENNQDENEEKGEEKGGDEENY